jgi:Tol biopolymer transport system component
MDRRFLLTLLAAALDARWPPSRSHTGKGITGPLHTRTEDALIHPLLQRLDTLASRPNPGAAEQQRLRRHRGWGGRVSSCAMTPLGARQRSLGAVVLLAGILALPVTPAGAFPGSTTRVSVDSAGNQGNVQSTIPSISATGRFVAFTSSASNLVLGDTNDRPDVFVHDRKTGITRRVSVDSAGNQGNDTSFVPSISATGRFVAFLSFASDLVPGDTNGVEDVFVHDRKIGTTMRVSVDSAENEGNGSNFSPSISATGRFVAFASAASNLVLGDTNDRLDVFVHDRKTGTTMRVSMDSDGNQGNDDSFTPSISATGRFVAFDSNAPNLVPEDTNSNMDVFVHDRKTGTTTRVSVDSAGNEGNNASFFASISANGRFVAFVSSASNLVLGDTNGLPDVFVHDRKTGTTTRVSVDSDGSEGNNRSFFSPSISATGRFVAFTSVASNLVPGDTNDSIDVFVHDRKTGTTRRVSVDSGGNQGNADSSVPSISATGRFVAFASSASNLVRGDTNRDEDVFVHDVAPKAFGQDREDADDDGVDDDAED